MNHDLSPEAEFEIACARAGNVLFCPLAGQPDRKFASLPELYEDSAHLMRLLVAGGLRSRHGAHYDAIVEIANALSAAIEWNAGHAQCADCVLYRLEGVTDAQDDKRRLAKLKAIIGTFYANLLIARVSRR